MILNRDMELEYLNNCYQKEGSQLVVVYGQKNVGKKTLLKEITKDKPFHYFKACASTERQQQYLWGNELRAGGYEIDEYPSFSDIFRSVNQDFNRKFIYIIDDFSHIAKTSKKFMNNILDLLRGDNLKQEVLVILCSSSIGWIENNMVSKIGRSALEITGFLKVKGLGFYDVVNHFPSFSKQECLQVYSILGGIPGLWNYFDDSISIKQNICQNILATGSVLYEEGNRIIKEELRELSVYSTILSAIAGGKHKLNDLFLHTGFSRAKISVYLKNLIELEIVEKVFSFDTKARENTQKGIYRISNHYVNFCFRFIYPNISYLNQIEIDEYYDKFVRNQLNHYFANYFEKACMQYMEKQNAANLLPIKFIKIGEWVGKVGTIPIIAENENGEIIIGMCSYDNKIMTYSDYEWLLFCATKAKINAKYFYLFTLKGFDEQIVFEANVKSNLKTVVLDNFY